MEARDIGGVMPSRPTAMRPVSERISGGTTYQDRSHHDIPTLKLW
ncbi:MAG TPA: hypothetical protein VGM00_06395 [Bradyrhizobium sp.]|jgi:hypothetical protein